MQIVHLVEHEPVHSPHMVVVAYEPQQPEPVDHAVVIGDVITALSSASHLVKRDMKRPRSFAGQPPIKEISHEHGDFIALILQRKVTSVE